MGPQNGIVGGQSPVQLPQTQIPDTPNLNVERGMAMFAATDEWERLKERLQSRIDAYKAQFTPGMGSEAANLPNEERGWRWLVAEAVTSEFQGVITDYEAMVGLVAEVDKAEAMRAAAEKKNV